MTTPTIASVINIPTYFKILTLPEFSKFQRQNVFTGNDRDLKSGYIHMCNSRAQVDKVIQKHYSKENDIFILSLNFKRRVNIFTERASDGDLYPHLFGDIEVGDVSFIQAI